MIDKHRKIAEELGWIDDGKINPKAIDYNNDTKKNPFVFDMDFVNELGYAETLEWVREHMQINPEQLYSGIPDAEFPRNDDILFHAMARVNSVFNELIIEMSKEKINKKAVKLCFSEIESCRNIIKNFVI